VPPTVTGASSPGQTAGIMFTVGDAEAVSLPVESTGWTAYATLSTALSVEDQDVACLGDGRLAINIIFHNGDNPTLGTFALESPSDWTQFYWSATSAPNIAIYGASMETAGTMGGGAMDTTGGNLVVAGFAVQGLSGTPVYANAHQYPESEVVAVAGAEVGSQGIAPSLTASLAALGSAEYGSQAYAFASFAMYAAGETGSSSTAGTGSTVSGYDGMVRRYRRGRLRAYKFNF